MEVMRQSNRILLVSDGSGNANGKIRRAFGSMRILEQQGGSPITDKMLLLYNRFQNQSGELLEDLWIPSLGGVQQFRGIQEAQIAAEIAKTGVFGKLM